MELGAQPSAIRQVGYVWIDARETEELHAQSKTSQNVSPTGAIDILPKAREELCKQFVEYVESLAKGFQRPETYQGIDGVIEVRNAIDALDRAIENRWERTTKHQRGLASAYRLVSVEKGINNPDDLDG